jgi:hypothetical protein
MPPWPPRPRGPSRATTKMPRGPRGEKHPADVIGAAVMVGRIATGEIEEKPKPKSGRVRSGHAGAEVRAKSLSPEKRKAIAKSAAAKRWGYPRR